MRSDEISEVIDTDDERQAMQAEPNPCLWCGGNTVIESTRGQVSCPDCGIKGPVNDPHASDWNRLTDDMQFLVRVRNAVIQGRRKHPWRGRHMQFLALLSEVCELAEEVHAAGDDRRKLQRVQEEAMDVAVVALRIVQGR